MGMKPEVAAVEVHIEELVLRGFAAADRVAIATAVEAGLRDLLSRHGLPAHARSLGRVDGGSLRMQPGAHADAIGGGVAGALFRQLAPARAPRPKGSRSAS